MSIMADGSRAGRALAQGTLFAALTLALPFLTACASSSEAGRSVEISSSAAAPSPASPRGNLAADDPFSGRWEMATRMGSRDIEAVLTLERDATGALQGLWTSQGQEMELFSIEADGAAISFDRQAGASGPTLHFEGLVDGDSLTGAWSGAFGELPCSGRRAGETESVTESASERVTDQHSRPMLREDGRTLLWAGGSDNIIDGEAADGDDIDWFDLTDSVIDPERFQYGVGRDSISSIDAPVFVAPDDETLAQRGVDAETPVLGVVMDGIARAYPVDVMDMHEIVNDTFGDKPYAVLW